MPKNTGGNGAARRSAFPGVQWSCADGASSTVPARAANAHLRSEGRGCARRRRRHAPASQRIAAGHERWAMSLAVVTADGAWRRGRWNRDAHGAVGAVDAARCSRETRLIMVPVANPNGLHRGPNGSQHLFAATISMSSNWLDVSRRPRGNADAAACARPADEGPEAARRFRVFAARIGIRRARPCPMSNTARMRAANGGRPRYRASVAAGFDMI